VQKFIIRRSLMGILVVLIVTLFVFAALNLLPGDPVVARQGNWVGSDQAVIDQLKHQLGLDLPVPQRYLMWLAGAISGNFGVSYITQESVGLLISQRMPASVELALSGFLVALILAIPAAILAAIYHDSWIDWIVTGFVTVGMAVPSFWLGIMLMLLFSVRLDWLPSVGYEPLFKNPGSNLHHLILPAVTLGLVIAAPIMRFLRSSLLDVMRQEYVTVARAKGLREVTILLRHTLRNAMLPTITVIGLQFGNLLGGAVIIEWIFSWPGMGWLTVDAVFKRDYSVVQGTVTLLAAGFVVLNIVIDLLYAELDPRIRYS
jgi:peptide/nickel transport system permease protein